MICGSNAAFRYMYRYIERREHTWQEARQLPQLAALPRKIPLYLLIGPKLACAAFRLGAVVEMFELHVEDGTVVVLPCSVGAVVSLRWLLVVTSKLHVSAVKFTLHTSLTDGNRLPRLARRSTQLLSISKVRDSTDGGMTGRWLAAGATGEDKL
jgi:hypothetical protein